MHELALARRIVEIVHEEARRSRIAGVKRVVLEIGALSCVDPQALSFGFDAAADGTLAAGAALDVERPPGTAQCFACEQTVEIGARGEGCPACGSHQLFVISGDDMVVKSLEAA
ncbi:MAG: hydrogenase maturation nickel metallochaperone HypA [Pseudomonadota bacterium]